MSRWFRHYAGMMRDDKLVRVAIRTKQPIERITWIWGAILESAAEIDDNGRYDIDPAEIAYFLRADQDDVDAAISGLEDAGRLASGCVVKWGDRQFKSDRSATRVAAYRDRKRAENRGIEAGEASQNGDVTLQKRHGNAPETETDTETEKEDNNYRFSGRVIKLTEADFAKWESSYSAIDLSALLQSRDDWLAEEAPPEQRKKWFTSTSNWLASKQQQATAAKGAPGEKREVDIFWG